MWASRWMTRIAISYKYEHQAIAPHVYYPFDLLKDLLDVYAIFRE